MVSKLKAASVSITINIFLLASKIFAAIVTGSVGLLAECAHSLFDLFSSFLAYLGIKKAEEPDDDTHHYGHEKFESLSSMLQALFIALTAIFIVYEATEKIIRPVTVDNSEFGIILMIISIPITLYTARYLAKVAEAEGGSQALEADSAHFTTDVLGSIAVLIGLILVKIGYSIGDIIAAYIVALIMIVISWKLMKESFLVFMDYTPKTHIMDDIRSVLDSYEGITYHKLRARRAGNRVLGEVHIQVNRKLDVVSAHEIAMDLKKKIIQKTPVVKEITIHIEPKAK